MKIVKFCLGSHNPVVSRQTKIQTCTLYYYKTIGNDFIRDLEEGVMTRSLNPSAPSTFTGNEIGKMTGLSIGGTGTIRLERKAVTTKNLIPNAYVFCTSRTDHPTLEQAKALGYDSFYGIKDPELFCERMREELRKSLPHASDVLAFHGAVRYLKNKEALFEDLPAFIQSHRIIDPSLYLLKHL